jgi:predicted nucleic acid-binding protein
MADEIPLYYWDACLFLDFINKRDPVWPLLEALLTRSKNREGMRIVTSTISITEVAMGGAHQLNKWEIAPEIEARIDGLWDIRGPVALVEFDRSIAFRARDIMRRTQGKIKGMDAIHVASAISVEAEELNTYDSDHLLPMGDSLGVPILEPSGPVQFEMPLPSDEA